MNGQLGGDLSASLVACWPSMPDERALRRRAAPRWRARPSPATTRRAMPVDGRPLNQPIQSVQPSYAVPDDALCREENSVTVDFQRKFRTSKMKSNVPATILIQRSSSNSQLKSSNVIPKMGSSGYRCSRLSKIC